MPPAARVTDMHTCPMVTGTVPHVGGPILPPGVPTVIIDGLPAATVTDMLTCVGPPDTIIRGSSGVFINFLPAARLGDSTAHGGVIVLGSPTCIIGETGAPSPGAGGLGGVVAGLVVGGAAGPLTHTPAKLSSANQQLTQMYQQAPAAKAEIDSAARSVAEQHGGSVATTEPKSRERAMEKALAEYRGNALQVKDLVRNTIVVPAGTEMQALASLQAALPGKVHAVKIITAAEDPCGYSGINVVVRTSAGLMAEVQINSPEMIYAKEKPEIAKRVLPANSYDKLAGNPQLPAGGQGHTLYEAFRKAPPGSPQAKAAATASRAYYNLFRGDTHGST